MGKVFINECSWVCLLMIECFFWIRNIRLLVLCNVVFFLFLFIFVILNYNFGVWLFEWIFGMISWCLDNLLDNYCLVILEGFLLLIDRSNLNVMNFVVGNICLNNGSISDVIFKGFYILWIFFECIFVILFIDVDVSLLFVCVISVW